MLVEIDVPDGGIVTDYLHPEWPNLRFHSAPLVEAQNLAGSRIGPTTAPFTGPSAKALRFTTGSARIWSVGLLPLGWAMFVGAPACDFADAVVDGRSHEAFAALRPLIGALFGREPDPSAELARIIAFFEAAAQRPLPDAERIRALHAALVDPEVNSVGAMADHAGLSQRTVERGCRQMMGFGPKLLLRRQRFMRSLSHFMQDPGTSWSAALDSHYHDQAQFVREFRGFMGMTPSQYAALNRPVLDPVMAARARFAGSAVQVVDRPALPLTA